MTDAERTALKAEIVAELGRHLDEHYLKLSDLETYGDQVVKTVGEPLGQLVGDMGARLLDVEIAVALTDVHRGIDVTDGPWWDFVGDLRDRYTKGVRRRVAKWMVKSASRLGTEVLGEDGLAHISRLEKLLGRD